LDSDTKGRINAGTYGEGLYVLDETTGQKTASNSIRDGKISQPDAIVTATYFESTGPNVA
jgi:hypothetical protein